MIRTFTLSNFFHQSLGIPVPLTLEAAPLDIFPLAPRTIDSGATKRGAVFQGSSGEKLGTAARGVGEIG